MGALWWTLCGSMLAGGLVAAVVATIGTTAPKGQGRTARWRAEWSGGPDGQQRAARRRLLIVAAVATTAVVWLVSGVFVAALILGGSVIGVPWLLSSATSAKGRIAKLEALADWAQRLSEILRLGFALEQALITSRKNPPPAIEAEVGELADKLKAGWLPVDALRDFAGRLDDVTGDKACAALMLCAVDPGPGLAQVLEDVAGQVREEVAARRRIEADRAKSRTAMRTMTLICMALILIGFLIPYTAPYATLLGQLVLALLGAAFAAVLWWTRKLATHQPVPRFLINDPRSQVKQPGPAEPVEVPAA
ncbi:type II secretion system F family protein [Streptomyces sp. NBC_00233]|uniref:type II secretion system F family protein n=1 Tax=Streptomyces sp. NBC_00233 TaxID=2975686 RepID=UPI002253FA5A|nr:type II secretion system F family protein [Streptomyces sp. NBC_00233]MCX5231489.1 type II secretion system F family protein [Streptomyces sp. NBC_00233]MCX5233163.1 type II secretion system F family protein [Streptomyces sp. NBC_00233]MCX5233604.1 type II secretion system F family protein [Streptomyces sp. NBC_00233]